MASQEISADFPFSKKKKSILDSTIAYIDTGAPTPSSPTVVFVHGNPTSSYIWRNIIPHISSTARCIAPDLIGFGDSGKMPSNSYRVIDQIRYFDAFVDTILTDDETKPTKKIFLVIQDWGSALGFHWASQHEERVAGLAFMEFILTGTKVNDLGDGAQLFRDFRTEGVGRRVIIDENVFIELVLAKVGVARGLSEAVMAHYRAPFIDPCTREPIYRFPNEIPFDGQPADVDELVRAYFAWLAKTSVPKLMFWGNPGAIVTVHHARELANQMQNIKTVEINPGRHY